jgi:hypothetical protein
VPSAYGNFASDTKAVAGDIWFGRNNQPYYDLTGKGTWGYATMMHEIGHTMGLKHGHQDYTNSDLSGFLGTVAAFRQPVPDPGPRRPGLVADDLYAGALHQQRFAGEKISQPQTYMQYDVAALQYLYGANFNTNSGDSVYTFSQTTGEMFINGVGQGAPAGNRIFLTIWDGGGNDTIDASNYANGVTIDLRPGEFSTSTRISWSTTSPIRTWSTWRPATSPCRCSTTTTPVADRERHGRRGQRHLRRQHRQQRPRRRRGAATP